MDLNQTLTLVATQLKADPNELIQYAAEDTLGGYHWDERQRQFPSGSLWKVEGQILYALVRWLKPETIVEIGGWAGASASHLAAAVTKNGKGKIISVDNEVGGMKHGNLLAPEYHDLVTLVKTNGEDWLAAQPDGSIGFVFEDADHSTALVRLLAGLALQKIEPGGLLVNHDAAHDFAYVGGGVRVGSSVGREVRDGLAQANAYFKPYLADPSDCGLAITVVPGARNLDKHSTKTDEHPLTAYEQARQKLTPQEFDALRLGQWLQPEGPLPDQTQLVGNANIESVSEPPPVITRVTVDAEAQEPDVTEEDTAQAAPVESDSAEVPTPEKEAEAKEEKPTSTRKTKAQKDAEAKAKK